MIDSETLNKLADAFIVYRELNLAGVEYEQMRIKKGQDFVIVCASDPVEPLLGRLTKKPAIKNENGFFCMDYKGVKLVWRELSA